MINVELNCGCTVCACVLCVCTVCVCVLCVCVLCVGVLCVGVLCVWVCTFITYLHVLMCHNKFKGQKSGVADSAIVELLIQRNK